MREYTIKIPNYTEFEKKLQKETDFFKYMELLKEALPHYALMIIVGDTPSGPMFTSIHANAMINALGLKLNMINAFRMPYIAIINNGNLIYESSSKGREEPVFINGALGKHTFSAYSGGFDCNLDFGFGFSALITIDGKHYFGNSGYNFFLYNIQEDYIVDMCNYEAWNNLNEHTLHRPTSIIKEFIANLSDRGILCFTHRPMFTPISMRSEQENLISKTKFRYNVLSDENALKNIWDNKTFHFVNDFDTKEDLLGAVTPPDAFEDIDGIMKFKDHKSNAVNTKNGIRITTDQPQNPKRAIYIFGPCTTFGIGAKDSCTIASYLQRKLNECIPEEKFIVYNYGFYLGGISDAQEKFITIIKSLPIQKNDIILFEQSASFYGLPFCDLTEKSKRPHNYGDIFLDYGIHFTANGNRMIADGFFDFLKEYDFFKNTKVNIINAEALSDTINTKNRENELLTKYKDNLKSFFKTNISPKVGAIVMNANPFTYGHRALVEEALKNCDYLIVFVVEEDKSDIPFKDRIMLVRENLKDLSGVFILPSGEFIISCKTFSEYFRKESLQEQKIDTSKDVTLFAKEIAPCLNISIRFAGEEPTDKITRQYNEDMAKILPMYGIEFMEIKRKITDEGEVISASTVRKLVRACEYEKLETLVPPVTFEYLKRKYV